MRTTSMPLTLLVLTFVSYNVALSQQPRDRTDVVTVDWLEHVSADGRYRAEFPSKPKIETQEAKSPEGVSFTQYFALAADATGMYMVGYFDYSSQQTFSLEKARDGMIKAVNGTLVSDQVITVNGASARESKLEVKLPNGRVAFSLIRILDVNGRVYILQHMFFKDSDQALASLNTQRFFKSFSVTESR